MHSAPFRLSLVVCAVALVLLAQPSWAANLCVNPGGTHGCFASIQAAVNNASPNDVINVAPGTYKEEVDIGMPLSIIGSGAHVSVVEAANLNHGFFVDGFDHPGLQDVTVAGFTVQHALYEGVLVVSARDITIRDSEIVNNDTVPGVQFTGALMGCPNQPGTGTYEMDETGDCGGAIHLVGTANSILSGNVITGNADGVLISDETGESHHNLLIHNTIKNNPLECGIVLASHPNAGNAAPPFAPHYGVDHNTIADNISDGNGVQIGGAGVGLFSDGAGQGTVVGNLIINNELKNNGLGGVTLHTHVGPALPGFPLPPDHMGGNTIVGNFISGNLPDLFDTATPGKVGININSGGGGSPVTGTVISHNVIRDEDIDIAVNTPAEVDIHLNDLRGGKIGVGDVCALDGSTACTGSIDASQNYWGCPAGPGGPGCTTASGSDVSFTPWLRTPAVP